MRQKFYETLRRPLELPCGVILKNRLVKSPMSDSLGDGEGNPTEAQIRLYERWAEGGVGLSVIGEVQGDPRYPEKPGNLVMGTHSNHSMLKELTARGSINGAQLWAQLGHAGALSYPPVSNPKGPSPMDLKGLKCGGMTTAEVQGLPVQFAKTAAEARSAGFGGVMIHSGHGFLLSQFLSPLFNRRRDPYGGSLESRAGIILEIIEKVRPAVGPNFPVGIRINSSDQLEGGLNETDALKLIRLLDETSIDLIDISGGTYFPGAKASTDRASQGPYFIDFSRKARKITEKPLMLTGGIKTPEQAVEAVTHGGADLAGLGRAIILDPGLPENWLNGPGTAPIFPRFEPSLPGGVTAWYTLRLAALSEDREKEFTLSLQDALRIYEERDQNRTGKWNKKFQGFLPVI